MRNWTRASVVAAAIMVAAGLGGCRRDLEYHFGPLAVAQPEARAAGAEQRAAARAASRKVRPVKTRVLASKTVHAGAKLRSFCGHRHVRFQAGSLRENQTEKARNDVLCRQVY